MVTLSTLTTDTDLHISRCTGIPTRDHDYHKYTFAHDAMDI